RLDKSGIAYITCQDRIDRDDKNEHEQEGRYTADGRNNTLDIQYQCQDNQHGKHKRTNNRVDAELLFKKRSASCNHDRCHTNQETSKQYIDQKSNVVATDMVINSRMR